MSETYKISSIIIFSISSFVIILSSISVVFPALLVRLTSGTIQSPISPFELGVFAFPILIVNITFFTFLFLYKKNFLPNFCYKITKSITNFDISNKLSLIILISILFIYVSFTYHEIFEQEIWPDYLTVLPAVNSWGTDDEFNFVQLHVRMFFLKTSLEVFDNIRVIPLMASVALLVVTYLLTVQLSSHKISGLVAVVIVLQSYVFRSFDSIATYTNFWVLFFFLSLYLVNKQWSLSFISYLASIFSKPLTIAFLPITIFHALRSDISKKHKLFYLLIFLFLSVVLILIASHFNTMFSDGIHFHTSKFFSGFSIFPYQLRFDPLLLMLLFPVNTLLYIKSRNGNKLAQSIQVLFLGVILSGPLLAGFLEFVINPYRLVPLIIAFAVGFGMIISKTHFSRINCQ
jgi:hypothetical protein